MKFNPGAFTFAVHLELIILAENVREKYQHRQQRNV